MKAMMYEELVRERDRQREELEQLKSKVRSLFSKIRKLENEMAELNNAYHDRRADVGNFCNWLASAVDPEATGCVAAKVRYWSRIPCSVTGRERPEYQFKLVPVEGGKAESMLLDVPVRLCGSHVQQAKRGNVKLHPKEIVIKGVRYKLELVERG